MRHLIRPTHLSLVALLALLLVGCGTPGNQVAAERAKASVEAYLAALEALPGDSAGIDEGLPRFEMAYQDLADPGIGAAIEAVYAPELSSTTPSTPSPTASG